MSLINELRATVSKNGTYIAVTGIIALIAVSVLDQERDEQEAWSRAASKNVETEPQSPEAPASLDDWAPMLEAIEQRLEDQLDSISRGEGSEEDALRLAEVLGKLIHELSIDAYKSTLKGDPGARTNTFGAVALRKG